MEQANWDVLRKLDKERFHDFILRADRERWEADADDVRAMLLAAGAAYEESRRLGNIFAHGREILRQAVTAPEAALDQSLAPEWDSLGVRPEAAPARPGRTQAHQTARRAHRLRLVLHGPERPQLRPQRPD